MIKNILIIAAFSVFMCGCATVDRTVYKTKESIVDACYTKLEYGKKETKFKEIDKYLNNRLNKGDISKSDKEIIDMCIRRSDKMLNKR